SAPPTATTAHDGMRCAASALVTLMPLPPASTCPPIARTRPPRFRLGTSTVRSTLGFRVTVRIVRPDVSRSPYDSGTAPPTLPPPVLALVGGPTVAPQICVYKGFA